MSQRGGSYQRSFQGMIGAMIILVAVVAVYVVFRSTTRNDADRPLEAVDYSGPAEYARAEADFDILAPATLPSGWKATSVRFGQGEDQSWHIGVLTDSSQYVGIEQAERSRQDMVAQFLGEDAEASTEVDIDGVTWTRWTGEDDNLALISEDGEAVSLVFGSVTEPVLEEYVASLD